MPRDFAGTNARSMLTRSAPAGSGKRRERRPSFFYSRSACSSSTSRPPSLGGCCSAVPACWCLDPLPSRTENNDRLALFVSGGVAGDRTSLASARRHAADAGRPALLCAGWCCDQLLGHTDRAPPLERPLGL